MAELQAALSALRFVATYEGLEGGILSIWRRIEVGFVATYEGLEDTLYFIDFNSAFRFVQTYEGLEA